MEVEQEKSKFQKMQTGDDLAIDTISNLYRKTINSGYQLLDSLSGYSSRLILKTSFSPPGTVLNIITLLQKAGFLSWHLFSSDRYNDAPRFFDNFMAPSYPDGITDGKAHYKAIGHGFSRDFQVALMRTAGEFLERFFLTLYHKKNFLRASYGALENKKIPVLDLGLLAGFSDEQKEANSRLKFDENSVFCWEKAKRFSTDKDVYLPAQLLHWNYIHSEQEPILQEGNTNGAGGMTTKQGAILAGLYELVQRDSFFIHWLNKLAPARINPHTVFYPEFQELFEESERYGFEIICLNVTVDTKIPAFVVIVSDTSGNWPCYSLGGGCGFDPAKALFRALEEAWSVYHWLRPRSPLPAIDGDYKPFSGGIGQDERLRLWGNPEMAKHLEFFISGKEQNFSDMKFDYPDHFPSAAEELKFAVKTIEDLGSGYEVYYYKAEHPVLKKINYYSVQVVVPQLVPLYLIEYDILLGSGRLKEVPSKIGLKAADALNTLPHLFP